VSVERSNSGPNIRRSRWRRPLAAAAIIVGSIGAAGASTSHAAPLTDGGWTTSVTGPTTVAPGQVVTLTVNVTAASAATALIDLEVYSLTSDGRGWQQSMYQVWDAQAFAAGQPRALQAQWTLPADEPTTVHWVKVGVFKPGWGVLYHWNDAATSFAVTTTPPTVPTAPPTTTTPPTTTPPTTTKPPTTTAAPTTVAPTTTRPPTTTAAPTTVAPTTTRPPTTTAAPTTAAPTTVPPAGLAFSEDFASAAAFGQRFDHGWSGQDPATWPASSNPRLSWVGDHDAACGDPAATSRTVTITKGAAGKEGVFYPCLPGGDPAKGHLMTSVNTEGYNIAWFAPKQYFNNVTRVCWDQNMTQLGGGKWTQVVLVAKADAEAANNDLGFVAPPFTDPNGPSTDSFPSIGTGGAKMFQGGFEIWRGDNVTGGMGGGGSTSDKAARYRHCMVDNENGTVTLTQARPNGTTATSTVSGDLPDGQVRVVFEDDSYNPDKHFDESLQPPAGSHLYTWHWDNIQIG
jgi:hypothetical protein